MRSTTEVYFDLPAADQALFLQDIDEILQRFEAALVDLESTPDDQELLQEIFRAAHTIKGNSATIGHLRMAALTHAMETRLDDVRRGVAPVTPELVEALLQAGDVLKLLRDEVETHQCADVDVDAAVAAVERRAGLRAPRSPSPAATHGLTVSETSAPLGTASRTIRVDVSRLDALLNLVGELVVDRKRLVQLANSVAERFGDDRRIDELQQTALHIGRITDELQEQVMKSRMLPVESVFSRLPRVVRDIAARQGKQVDFSIEGKATELDRSVIEGIRDPLLHLIRNSVDHGLEPAAERLAAGKPPVGKLRLIARHADSHIVITLADDGRGVPLDAVKRKAVERGAITVEQADGMPDGDAVQLIFEPGLSTATRVSDVSGRGVGMDIVRANVAKLNGSVEVSTRRGAGTTFTIRLPLTLAIIQALLVRVAGGIYALPIHVVAEALHVEPNQIHCFNGREATRLRGAVLPLVALRRLFGVQDTYAPEIAASTRLVVAVNAPGGRQIGLIVDGLIGEQQIVIKPPGKLVGDVPGLSGAAILGDGSVALILDVGSLAQHTTNNRSASSPAQAEARPHVATHHHAADECDVPCRDPHVAALGLTDSVTTVQA